MRPTVRELETWLPMTLSTVVVAYETEEAAGRRLEAFGYPPDVAAEIAVYLAQSTDLPHYAPDITRVLGEEGLWVEFVPLDHLAQRLKELHPRRTETIIWAMTDGMRFYRGSAVPVLARLEGFARFGSPAVAAHLAQDKFACLALASSAGLAVPPTRLMEGGDEVARLGPSPRSVALFVKPNTLGAKIGIFADSLCASEADAVDRARRIWDRYRDRALIQPFVAGDDVRASFIDCGGALCDQIGVERIEKNPASETGGAFLTMKDNETLSGTKDTAGARGGFGALRPAAFVPRMIDLRLEDDERSRRAVEAVVDGAGRLARLVGLKDCFSIDFRIDAAGRPSFFEFEVCPAVTIYDFQNYLAGRGYTLGAALGKSMRLAFARASEFGEA
jgi:D-alanine-D-alanine ligase